MGKAGRSSAIYVLPEKQAGAITHIAEINLFIFNNFGRAGFANKQIVLYNALADFDNTRGWGLLIIMKY